MEAQTGGLGTKDSMGELWCWGGTRRCLERLREEGPRPGGARRGPEAGAGGGGSLEVGVGWGEGWETRSAVRGAVNGGVWMALLVQVGPSGSGWLWYPCPQHRPGPRGAQDTGRGAQGWGEGGRRCARPQTAGGGALLGSELTAAGGAVGRWVRRPDGPRAKGGVEAGQVVRRGLGQGWERRGSGRRRAERRVWNQAGDGWGTATVPRGQSPGPTAVEGLDEAS